jgi:hypothetical protein
MGRTAKPRKAYRPRPVLVDALAKLQPAPHAQQQLVMTRFHSALHAMATGTQAGPVEWRDLADVVNTVDVLVNQMNLLHPQATMPTIEAAKAALVAAEARYRTTGRTGLDGPGLQALRDSMALYQQAAAGFTQHTMARARELVEQMCHQARLQVAATNHNNVVTL